MNSTDVITVENTLPMGQSTVTTEYNEVFDSFPGRYSPYTPLQAIFLIMVLSTIILATVIGNVLVCVAVFLVKRLRKPWNYLLVSLAVSDLCVALLVMPTALIYEISGEWPYGPAMCDFWVSLDVLSCTASILNLCMIAVDRFFAITKPLQYETKRTPRRMVLYISLVWFGAACISLPPLLVMGNEYTDPQDGPTHCTICQNFFYQIFATLGSFYLPLGVMIQVYYKIFCAARRLVVEEQRSQVHTPYQPREDFDDESGPSFLSRSVIPNVELEDSPVEQQSEKASMTVQFIRGTDDADEASESSSRAVLCLAGGSQKSSDSQSPMLQKVDKRTTSPMMSTKTKIARNHPSSTCGATNSPHQKKLKFHLAKERKASATLGIIMSAFIICWLPFFVLALVRPFLENPNSVPQFLSSLFLWLGYCNSLLNPIIYATLNKDFRKPFRQMLNLRFTNLNHAMREEFYQSQYGNPISNYETKAKEMKDFKRLKKKGLEEIDITPSGPNESFL